MPFPSARRSRATRENCRTRICSEIGQCATDRVRVDHHRRFGMDPDTGIPDCALPRSISLVAGAPAPLPIWMLRIRRRRASVPTAMADHASSKGPMPPHGDFIAGPDIRTVRHLHAQGAASRHPDQVLVELRNMDRRTVLRSGFTLDQPTLRTLHAGPFLRGGGRNHSVSGVAWRIVMTVRVSAAEAVPRVPKRTGPARRSRRCPDHPTC